MKRRFEQNQQDCVFTVLSLLPTLGDQLLHELNVELITAKLQQTRSQRPTPLPTPDTSMILPPKSTETTNGEHEANGEIKENESTTGGDQEQIKEETNKSEEANTEESPKAVEDTEAPKEEANGTQINGHTEKTEDSEKSESTEETTHVNGSSPPTPEIKVQEESPSTDSEKEQLHKAAQTVVRDEATAAIDRRTKLELWNELKVMSMLTLLLRPITPYRLMTTNDFMLTERIFFGNDLGFTRTVTALYSLTFLTLLTQVQLNLLGRFTYVSSVVALSSTTDASVRVESPTKGSMSSTNGQLDFQTEKKYLTFSYWLLHEGWRRWSKKVREVVEDIVGG